MLGTEKGLAKNQSCPTLLSLSHGDFCSLHDVLFCCNMFVSVYPHPFMFAALNAAVLSDL